MASPLLGLHCRIELHFIEVKVDDLVASRAERLDKALVKGRLVAVGCRMCVDYIYLHCVMPGPFVHRNAIG